MTAPDHAPATARATSGVRVLALLLIAAACGGRGRPRAAASGNLALPDAAGGFTAGAESAGPGFVRRTYSRGRTRIDVTLARAELTPQAWEGWVKTSVEAFPQAALDAPADRANGFYQCTEGAQPSCDLLIQLRSGVHVEIRGGGTSTRADADAIARALPLRALAGTDR